MHPVEFSAELQPTAGAQRQTGAFTPAAARSRHCHVRDPRMSLGFDGRWEMEFTARCEKRKRYGDCVCQARIAAHRPGGVVFETAARRFDVPNGPDWVRYDFGGDRGELRLAYTAVDRVSLQVLDAER
ncbi:MAG: hypothetical protein J4G09_01855 [Proteobacteria bacterium]|nr:hypothetical protein [Pseudomonadota bacterium]